MRITPDEALRNLKKLIATEWPKLSEADTRSKIITPIFTQCLNWSEGDFSEEEHSDTGFVDYVFRLGKSNILVVEAKKKGHSFKIPVTFRFQRKFSVSGALSRGQNVKGAMRQARRYCTEKGTRFGVITNGDQFIVFEAYRSGEDWEKGNCFVFYNLDDITRNFIDFWNLLSKDAVERGSLVESLSEEIEELRYERPVDNIHFKNEIQPRNRLYRLMVPIIRHAFAEITGKSKIEMMKKCYVLENEFDELNESLRRQFQADYTNNAELKKIIQGAETAGVFHMDFYKYADLVKQAPPEPTILLLSGRIGSGKTTFIHRFFNLVLLDEEREKIKWFYVNFKDAPREEKEIRSYILRSILEEFKSKHKELLDSIQKKLKLESLSTDLKSLVQLFLVLRYENYIPSLIIDNVDQHRVESSTFHEKVFLEANNLTKELGTITIMTLRESSFYRSALDGVFDAYNTERYELMPPDLRKILLYRLGYVIEKLDLPTQKLQQTFGTNLNYEPHRETIKHFLNIVKDTIHRSPRRSVSRFVARTSGGNVRRALDLFSRFLVSGNTKIQEILDTHRREGSYTIAEHQFVKSIVLGRYRYYTEEYSYLLNVFDFNREFSNSHFLKLRILNYAEAHITNDSEFGRGYVSINRLKQEARDIFVSSEAVDDSLIKLAKYGLILLNTRSRSSLEKASHFAITECGNYYLHALINRFSYIDLILADTPIGDVDLAKTIRRMLPSKDLKVRFERAKMFLDYLQEMEKREFGFHPEYRASLLGKPQFTSKMVSSFKQEKRYITERIREKALRF